jgi:hypothetical protein
MRLAALAIKPAHVTAEDHFSTWFAEVIKRLFNGTDLLVNSSPYRFAELEAYYHGPGHPDPFAHRHPLQLENGRWYFHRSGGEYRSGSFKGLDLALGNGGAYFGILIRSIIDRHGKVVQGPSLTVDHLLARTRTQNVAVLDTLIDGRKIWDTTSPLAIREAVTIRTARVYRSSRVGLSLKRARGIPEAERFVAQPYRFLTEPRAISKGKMHLVLTLHREGETLDAIHTATGCPKRTVERYIRDYVAGKVESGFDQYTGKDLNTCDLCKMLGIWAAKYGNTL